MAKGYVLAHVEVTEPGLFGQYREKVAATLAPFGGRFLVRGGDPEQLEGNRPARRIVLLEFDSRDRAHAWYHSKQYQEILPLRLQSAQAELYLISGNEPG